MIFKSKTKMETICKSKNCWNMSGNRKLYFRRHRRRKLSKGTPIVGSNAGSYKKILRFLIDILPGSGSNTSQSSTNFPLQTNAKQRCSGKADRSSSNHIPPEFVAKFWH